MASKGMISIGIKLGEGKDGLKTLINDARSLEKAMGSTVIVADRLDHTFINIAAVSTSMKGINDAFSQLGDALGQLTIESN